MDNFIVSARKYRPATFSTVVGQGSITSTLQNAIKNNILAQAFLFCGPRGVGKTTCARIMAKTINCLSPTAEMEACDHCESCVSFNRSASFNIHELDAASNNSVDDIRNLVDQVRIPPQIGKYKIYIIDEVHMLSQQAFNAFLKTLEEPPAYAKFILATTEKHKIIPTILSRCQIFDFKRITVDDIAKHLAFVAKSEKVEAEAEALNIIAQKADGALRDALSIFDQMVSFSGNSITYKDVISNLNILDYDYFFRITDSMLRADTSNTLLIINEIIDNGFDGQHFIIGMGKHLRSLLVAKDPATISLMEVSTSLAERYSEQAEQCSPEFLLQALNINNNCDINYRNSNNKRLHLEIALLQICRLQQQNSMNEPANMSAVGTPSQQAKAVATETKEPPKAYSEPKTSPKEAEDAAIVREVAPPIVKKPAFSINEIISKSEKSAQVAEPEKSAAFTLDELKASWKAFIEYYKDKSPSFATSLSTYEPELADDFLIRFKTDNSLLAEDKLNMMALTDYLKKRLDNTLIKLSPEVSDKPAKLSAYTDKEKFEQMAQRQPMLRQLKERLNLELDF
jgi:DNA polymerase III subunit gamma/tau